MRRKIVGNRVSKFKDYMYINDDTYIDYLERLKKIAISMFEWTNLPDSCDERFLELCLYYTGQAALLQNDDGIMINTKACTAGDINIYELPTSINCYSVGFNQIKKVYDGFVADNVKPEEYAVHVLNNLNRCATAYTLELFAYRLYLAQRTADVNISVNKMPFVITTEENQRLTMENLYNQISENRPAIFGDKEALSNLKESVKVLPTNPPFIADKLNDYKKEIWNEALSFLGINNLSEKKERLISNETNSNNELINLNLQSYLVPRQKAAEQFNKLFGLEGDKAVSVKVRSDLYNVIKQQESIVADYNGDGMITEEDTELKNE